MLAVMVCLLGRVAHGLVMLDRVHSQLPFEQPAPPGRKCSLVLRASEGLWRLKQNAKRACSCGRSSAGCVLCANAIYSTGVHAYPHRKRTSGSRRAPCAVNTHTEATRLPLSAIAASRLPCVRGSFVQPLAVVRWVRPVPHALAQALTRLFQDGETSKVCSARPARRARREPGMVKNWECDIGSAL